MYRILLRQSNIILTHLSILLNSFLGGDYNQSISCRNYILRINGYPNIVDFIDLLTEPYHCEEAYIYWKEINDAKERVSTIMKEKRNGSAVE